MSADKAKHRRVTGEDIVMMNVRIPRPLHDAAKFRALKENRSLNHLVVEAVRKVLLKR